MIMLKLDIERNYKPTTKVKRSQSYEKLFQKLLLWIG